jgi:hypothetical protein
MQIECITRDCDKLLVAFESEKNKDEIGITIGTANWALETKGLNHRRPASAGMIQGVSDIKPDELICVCFP